MFGNCRGLTILTQPSFMEAHQVADDQLAPVFTKRPTNYQPNLFTESKQEFTELEKKIVVLVVNQIGHLALKGELRPTANVVVSIPFSSLTRTITNKSRKPQNRSNQNGWFIATMPKTDLTSSPHFPAFARKP